MLLVLPGCSTVAYYAQAVNGQAALIAAARPFDAVLTDPRVDDAVRQRLLVMPSLLQFAVDILDLPDSRSYRQYVDLQRDAMVWSVVAAPRDSLDAETWCYPIVGCASYRGYFALSAATRFAEQLASQGLDVAIERVPAYSTLGWFADPLPSTVIDWPEPQMAGLVFHELAHQKLYLPGDSAFNEAYATVIEQEGVQRWLETRGDASALRGWQAQQARQAAFLRLLDTTRSRLAARYTVGGGPASVQRDKQRILATLRTEYAQSRMRWGGHDEFDAWFDRPLNNAHFASVATYHELVPALRELLRQQQGDMRAFHARCRELARMESTARANALDELEVAASSRALAQLDESPAAR